MKNQIGERRYFGAYEFARPENREIYKIRNSIIRARFEVEVYQVGNLIFFQVDKVINNRVYRCVYSTHRDIITQFVQPIDKYILQAIKEKFANIGGTD